MNLQVIDGISPRPAVGDLFSWLQTAANNISTTVKAAQPVVDEAKSIFSGSNTGIVNPGVQTQINPQQSVASWETYQQPQTKPNNTLLYVGLGAAALIAIIYFTKK